MNTVFKKAERKQAKLKLGLTGASGLGKTYSALAIASGMSDKIALVDTEAGSASLYSHIFDFDTHTINPDYTIPKYLDAIKAAEEAGFEVLIIDSISHGWAGDGGLLAKKEALDLKDSKGKFSNWGAITKEQESFKSAILHCKMHLICTMRSKQEYALQMNDKGKMEPVKMGLAPIQRDGIEYEFTSILDMRAKGFAIATKDRTGLFNNEYFTPSADTGKSLMTWLMEGKAPLDNMLQKTLELQKAKNITNETLKQIAMSFKIESLKTATPEILLDLNAYIQSNFP